MSSTLRTVALDDKYMLPKGRVYLTALQAIIRVLTEQRRLDDVAGISSAGFVSGYRGSPLAGLDRALWSADALLKASSIRFQPGLNEELAATAVAGTQHIGELIDGTCSGVFALWYGKQPGVDRSGDAFKHGNYAGTARHGGVVVVAGDDPGGKSSSIPNQSEQAFLSARMPVVNPATLQDYLDFGLFAFALSRFSGCWVGFKTVSDTVEGSGTAEIDPMRWRFRAPADFIMPDEAARPQRGYDPLRDERRLIEFRLPGAQAFARANGIDRIVIDAPRPRLGIATTGKTYLDVRAALQALGVDEARAAAHGLRVYKVGLTWPLEPTGALAFATGLEEVLVVEEKQAFIELQLARLLFNRPNAPARLVGKQDETGASLVPETGELSPAVVARIIAARLRRMGIPFELPPRLQEVDRHSAEIVEIGKAPVARTMFFCSGCPHNTSTKLPEGSRALAGIGCSFMSVLLPDRRASLSTQMGGEGLNWVGQAPFAKERHIFQNLGDGTYAHSGVLAIRAAVAAGVNITYKLLYNDAVAMTGGQPVEGHPTVDAITRQLEPEGVRRIVVVSDDVEKYSGVARFAPGVTIHHRRDLDAVQRELRDTPGVTVLIYDQTCAAEKRRRRKRGRYPDPDRRLLINPLVCEACGDCSRTSNCISVQPLETEFGRKRRIDQSSCNKDYSCVEGFCPSFVSVRGGSLRSAASRADLDPQLLLGSRPAPPPRPCSRPYGIVVTGIGGTGVITIGALLGMAAHLDGRAVTVLDDTGIAQKNGAVASHIRIAEEQDALAGARIDAGGADLLLGCDVVVAAAPDTLLRLDRGRTAAVLNTHVVPPASFIADMELDLSPGRLVDRIARAMRRAAIDELDATGLATALTGDSIAANLLVVGYALQKGLLPVSLGALEQAIRLNGVAVKANLAALAWGRLAAEELAKVRELAAPMLGMGVPAAAEDLATLVDRRAAFLADYQDAAYAARYRRLVERAAEAERCQVPGRSGFAEAVARGLFKLMAYKDEYEVARLYTGAEFRMQLERQFEGNFRLSVHLAPPLLARLDANGRPQKAEYGRWMFTAFRLLARLRRLRGTRLDLFGYTEERRMERRLVAEYEATVVELCNRLDPRTHKLARDIALLPEQMRGFGHVKRGNVERAKAEEARLLDQMRRAAEPLRAAG